MSEGGKGREPFEGLQKSSSVQFWTQNVLKGRHFPCGRLKYCSQKHTIRSACGTADWTTFDLNGSSFSLSKTKRKGQKISGKEFYVPGVTSHPLIGRRALMHDGKCSVPCFGPNFSGRSCVLSLQVTCLDLGQGQGRRLRRRVCWNPLQEVALCWWDLDEWAEEAWPWSPAHSQRNNLVLLSCSPTEGLKVGVYL